MTNEIHDKAEKLATSFEAIGINVMSVIHSTNRYGQHSSYIELGSGFWPRIRISDHMCNIAFRVNECNWFYGVEPEDAQKFIDLCKARQAEEKRVNALRRAVQAFDKEIRRNWTDAEKDAPKGSPKRRERNARLRAALRARFGEEGERMIFKQPLKRD